MTGYYGNVEEETLENENFRKVLFTGVNSQLVVMTIAASDDIVSEGHHDIDRNVRTRRHI